MRAAALVLDTLVLFVLPAVLVCYPTSRWALDRDLAVLWRVHGLALGLLFLSLFLILQMIYIGAFGRTPGMRLTSQRVMDSTGRVPSFSRALGRALIFPILIIPFAERLVGTYTISE